MIFRIGDFSRLCRVTVRTLRYYDEIGLLSPARVDQFTGYRYYSVDQLPKLNRIAMLKGIGLSLDDINRLLHNGMPADHIRQLLQVKQTEIQERLNQDNGRLRQVERWLDKINKEGVMPTDMYIQRKDVPRLRVISKRETGTYEYTPNKLREELLQQINRPENQACVRVTGPVMMLCHDEEYKEKDADIEMAVPISGEISINEPLIKLKILPRCRVISAIYKGPYDASDNAYAQIFEYAEGHNLKLTTPLRELYLNSAEEIPEDELLTEIQCPFHELKS
jgi:effector-binding domain-containing protein